MKRSSLKLLVAVLALAPLSASAGLPGGGPKPDMMVLIGSSRTMEFGVGFDAQTGSPVRAACSPAGAPFDPTLSYTKSRLETIKGVLAGRSAFEATAGYWCREADTPPLCGALPNAGQARIDQACGLDALVGRNQAMCCIGNPGGGSVGAGSPAARTPADSSTRTDSSRPWATSSPLSRGPPSLKMV